jgi:hypothetical protein
MARPKLQLLLLSGSMALAVAVAGQETSLPGPEGSLEETFRSADTDANGALSRNEALRAKLSLSEKETFDGIDSDKNGLLTLVEIGDALQGRIRAWTGSDRDGDGELTEEEAGSTAWLAHIFRRADNDRNGKVGPDEYETFSRRNLYGNVDLPSVAPNIFERKF